MYKRRYCLLEYHIIFTRKDDILIFFVQQESLHIFLYIVQEVY